MASSLLEPHLSNPAPVLHRWTAAQYHQLIESGLLPEGAPIELIDGLLVHKVRRDAGGEPMSHGPKHAIATENLGELNSRLRSLGYFLWTQKPIALSDTSEPEPDGAIVRGASKDFTIRHPEPAEIAIVVEVSDSSLKYDRNTKQRVYASAGMPVYWIINLPDNRVEVYSDPSADEGKYRELKTYRPGEPIEIALANSIVTVDPAELLP